MTGADQSTTDGQDVCCRELSDAARTLCVGLLQALRREGRLTQPHPVLESHSPKHRERPAHRFASPRRTRVIQRTMSSIRRVFMSRSGGESSTR